MSCEQLQNDFVPFLLGELELQAELKIEAHLASCTECIKDFSTLKDAVEMVFSSIPAAALDAEQRHRVLSRALRPSAPARGVLSLSSVVTAERSAALRSASTPWHMMQALLSLSAGFFLMISWQAWHDDARPDSQTRLNTTAHTQGAADATLALSGDPQLLPHAKDTLHFVSVKKSPSQPPFTGYFLVDPFSSQVHLVGKIAPQPPAEVQYQLTIVTYQSILEVPIDVDAKGHFKVIVALPDSPIREVVLKPSL